MLKQRIDQDLKKALLAGDKPLVNTLRNIKSVILYAEVARGERESGLSDNDIVSLLTKEAKKRQESADLYVKGDSKERAAIELEEKRIIEQYLPQQLSDIELEGIVSQTIEDVGADPKNMGVIIGEVKMRTNGGADGARIARVVKERLDTSR